MFTPATGKTTIQRATGGSTRDVFRGNKNGAHTKFTREVVMPTKLKTAPKFKGTLKRGQRIA
jgi:hypothetical protein